MKKSTLALGALTVVGGLCLAGSAQAVYYFGLGQNGANSTGLDLNPGSMGNELIVPYYSAQDATHTNIDIVNTDQINGKAVKVRFRGAANSDDVLDFTVLMSPGDVWNADIYQQNGLAHVKTADKTCTLPEGPINTDFIPSRFPGYMQGQPAAKNTLEGYVEILNMADIPPKTKTASPESNTNALYNAIKHANGTPACGAIWPAGRNAGVDALQALLDTNNPANGLDLLNDYGLEAPTGQLTGGWALINQTNFASFSANDTAVRATGGANSFVAISPQIQGPAAAGLGAAAVTADPLLTGNGAPIAPVATLQWYDIPDLSTPMLVGTNGNPTLQAETLAIALGKTTFNDEYINDANGPTPMSTDLVFSQPTRRYFAVVDYASSAATARIIYNDNVTSGTGADPSNALPYAGETADARRGVGAGILTVSVSPQTFGPVACLLGIEAKSYDQEETTASTAASFSPGVTNPELCGEVATMTWGNSPLSAALTNTQATTSYKSGWINVGLPTGTGPTYGLPVTGFSAINATNGSQGYGITWGIRW